MDNMVDAMNNAYQEFVNAVATTIESKELNTLSSSSSTSDTSLENVKQKWELFRVACDQAEEFVESVKLRIGSECLVDEATGMKPNGQQPSGIPPISAVRLEQMSKAVRWLVIELQQGSGGGGSGSAGLGMQQQPFDARFHEDSAQ
uniref:mediator of RNA polymerase II transcription subunit 32 n=1 Tax=Erigeron canadensis TaxID=72917 RepID=UPI001CB9945E|nr:mediator of RNA polymerase II transcription subunit 32 [Erigeron canadensis]